METQERNTKDSKFTIEEKKEKLLLDIFFIKNQLGSSNSEKIDTKEIKKNLSQLETDLESFFEIQVSNKTKKDYVNLKNTKFDEELFRLAKYL